MKYKISTLVQVVPRLPTALLIPTARTLNLSITFCACIVQQAKYNRLCPSVQQTEIFGVSSKSCFVHYKADLTIPRAFQTPSPHNRRDTVLVTDAGFRL